MGALKSAVVEARSVFSSIVSVQAKLADIQISGLFTMKKDCSVLPEEFPSLSILYSVDILK